MYATALSIYYTSQPIKKVSQITTIFNFKCILGMVQIMSVFALRNLKEKNRVQMLTVEI